MSDLEKAARMALEALEEIHPGNMTPMAEEAWNKAITALRQAIEQAEQAQPVEEDRVMTVVYRNVNKDDARSFMDHPKAVWFGWCHAPYQRDEARYKLEKVVPPPRKPLTDEEIEDIWNRYCDELGEASINDALDIARAIEAAHGIKGEA